MQGGRSGCVGLRFGEVSRRLALALQVDEAFRGSSLKVSSVDHGSENRRLKRELARVTEERDTLKNRHGPLPACARYKQLVLLLVA